MSKSRLGRSKPTTDRVLESMTDETRREAVAVLRERTSPIPVEQLAAAVVAARRDTSVDGVEADERTTVAVDLAHVHLPALADAGLVEWSPDDGVVVATDHPAYDDELLQGIISVEADDWEAVVARLADARRRRIVSILEEGDGTIGRRALARRVAAREIGDRPSGVAESTVDAVETSLYHVHIPTLRRVGLVESDGETVNYAGHPDLESAWLSIDLDDTVGTDDSGSSPRDVDGTQTSEDGGTSVEAPQTTFDEAGD